MVEILNLKIDLGKLRLASTTTEVLEITINDFMEVIWRDLKLCAAKTSAFDFLVALFSFEADIKRKTIRKFHE